MSDYTFEAIFFDLDGLLIDSEPFWRIAQKEVFGEVGIHLSEEDMLQTTGIRIHEITELYYREHSWSGPTPEEVTQKVIERVLELIHREGKAKPGTNAAIETAGKMSKYVGVVSSSPAQLIEPVIDFLELREHMDLIQSADEVEFGKPHPAVYLLAAEKLSVNPENCLVLEDSFNGMIAGLSARMKVIAVPEEEMPGKERFHAADSVLDSLLDFTPDLVHSLSSSDQLNQPG